MYLVRHIGIVMICRENQPKSHTNEITRQNNTILFEAARDDDLITTKTMRFFCQGRGCRHGDPPELKPTAVAFYIKVVVN